MKLVIENHFELQEKNLDFSQIHYYRQQDKYIFDNSDWSIYKKEDVIDFCLIDNEVVLACLEVWVDRGENLVKTSFISTHPDYLLQDFASFLYDTLISWMKLNHPNKVLVLNRPGLNCPAAFTLFIDNKLYQKEVIFIKGYQR